MQQNLIYCLMHFNILRRLFIGVLFYCIGLSACLAANTTISGMVNYQKVAVVRIGLYTNLITEVPDNYLGKVQKNNTFTVNFNLKSPVYGFLDLNGAIYNIFVMPGKHAIVRVIKNTVLFQGASAAENSFLLKLKNSGGWNYDNYDLKIHPDSNFSHMRAKQVSYAKLLGQQHKHHPLSVDFIKFFRAHDACLFNKFLLDFPNEYVASNHLKYNDDPVFSKHFFYRVDFYVNDNYLISPEYISIIQQYMNFAPEIYIPQRLKRISGVQARNGFMTDTLSGKTREYILGNQIYIDVLFKNRPDTVIIDAFKHNAANAFAITVVDSILKDYRLRTTYQNKVLSKELNSTVLIADNGKEIMLGDVLAKHAGNVLLIDVWGLVCPPCRAEVPYEQKLKKTYDTSPFDIIHITTDSQTAINWPAYYKAAGTKANHYVFKQGYNAPFLKAFGIFWTPEYLIIDKEGKLVSFNAPQPSQEAAINALISKSLN
jgi:thiol-disulfide isomerase/thioredoxin